jgi:hypothetical protein
MPRNKIQAKIYQAKWRREHPDYSKNYWKSYVRPKQIKSTNKKRKYINCGITGREYTRSRVRERDENTCQICKKVWQDKTKRFDVHHLNGLCGKKSRGYDSIKDMDGLITLCHKCHFNHPQHSQKLKQS